LRNGVRFREAEAIRSLKGWDFTSRKLDEKLWRLVGYIVLIRSNLNVEVVELCGGKNLRIG
jgi:hypothetical protein